LALLQLIRQGSSNITEPELDRLDDGSCQRLIRQRFGDLRNDRCEGRNAVGRFDTRPIRGC